MGDSLKKVRPGQPMDIPAAGYNAFVDAARAHKAGKHALVEPRQSPAHAATILLVKNSSGSDRDRFDVLGIDDVVYDPTENLAEFKNNPAIDGVTPAAADHTGRFVILLEPVPDGRIGRGLLMGVCPVKIDVQAETNLYADVDDGQTGRLKSGSLGAAAILWKEAGTGEKWALVSVGAGVDAAAAGVKINQDDELGHLEDKIIGDKAWTEVIQV